MRRVLAAAVVMAALAAGAGCESPQKVEADGPSASAPTSEAASGTAPTPAAGPTTTSPHFRTVPVPGAKPAGEGAPPAAGVATAPKVTAASPEWDAIDRRAPVPADAIRIIAGRTNGVDYRVYVFKSQGRSCVQLYEKTPTGGGGPFARCDYKEPIDSSGSDGDGVRIRFGIVTARAVKVRVEHAGGSADTFDAIAVEGFPERFWGGPIGAAPVVRFVALDADGKTVGAEDYQDVPMPTG